MTAMYQRVFPQTLRRPTTTALRRRAFSTRPEPVRTMHLCEDGR